MVFGKSEVIVTATSVDTGIVIDVYIMSKHCRCPHKLKNEHAQNCVANYSGTSGGMEVAGVINIYNVLYSGIRPDM